MHARKCLKSWSLLIEKCSFVRADPELSESCALSQSPHKWSELRLTSNGRAAFSWALENWSILASSKMISWNSTPIEEFNQRLPFKIMLCSTLVFVYRSSQASICTGKLHERTNVLERNCASQPKSAVKQLRDLCKRWIETLNYKLLKWCLTWRVVWALRKAEKTQTQPWDTHMNWELLCGTDAKLMHVEGVAQTYELSMAALMKWCAETRSICDEHL